MDVASCPLSSCIIYFDVDENHDAAGDVERPEGAVHHVTDVLTKLEQKEGNDQDTLSFEFSRRNEEVAIVMSCFASVTVNFVFDFPDFPLRCEKDPADVIILADVCLGDQSDQQGGRWSPAADLDVKSGRCLCE